MSRFQSGRKCPAVPAGGARIFLFLLLLAAEGILRADTPVFERPDPGSAVIAVRTGEFAPEPGGTVHPGYLPFGRLVRQLNFREIVLAPGRSGFAAPELGCTRDASGGVGEPVFHPSRPAWRWWFALANLAAGAAVIGGLVRKRLPGWTVSLLPVFLRNILVIWIVQLGGNLYLLSSDEPDFFAAASGILSGDWTGPWNRTLGLPLLYLPFLLLTGADSVFGILPAFSMFNALFFGGAAVFLLYWFVERLLGSPRRALACALIYAVLPFFLFHSESDGVFRAFAALPDPAWSFGYYKSLTWAGFNAMSDTPSTALLFLSAVLLLRGRWGWCAAAWTGGVFALACLVRINNIFFAPFLAWIFWSRAPVKRNWRVFLAPIVAGSAVFLAILLPQLAVNAVQLGSPFTTPFILHDRAAEGFRFDQLAGNIPALFGSNLPWFAAGLFGLAALRDRGIRVALGWWILPTLLFFCGYVFTAEHTTRFLLPLYGALIAAAAGALSGQGRRRWREAALLVAATALFWYFQLVWPLFFLALAEAVRLLVDTWREVASSFEKNVFSGSSGRIDA